MRIEHPTDKVNFSIVEIRDYSIAFSYQTPIGFRAPGKGWVVRENDWSNTTGKHLNWLNDDKSQRIPSAEFEARLSEMLNATINTEAGR